ncbi:MAG: TIGR04255 family protein [Spirosomataceae bacterium]|jgi:uncharacterized protein (TIGR04255 family)
MHLPSRIEPCPIIDAIIEIRFTSKINANAVFGILYGVLQEDFKNVETLPILQIPEVVRVSDPNLKYKPYYKISNEAIITQIGPDVITISSFPEYLGWKDFSQRIFKILNKIITTGIFEKIERLGIRYINFFETEIFNKVNLSVTLNSNNINLKNTIVRTEIEQESFTSTLQIANNVNINQKFGSIIDIDTFTTFNLETFFEEKEKIINSGHDKEKELFFKLLKSEFLKSLNPQYLDGYN